MSLRLAERLISNGFSSKLPLISSRANAFNPSVLKVRSIEAITLELSVRRPPSPGSDSVVVVDEVVKASNESTDSLALTPPNPVL